MANSSPHDTYAIRLRQGQWLVIRPKGHDESNQKKNDSEEKDGQLKIMWLRKG